MCAEKKDEPLDYKSSLNLPKTDFPMRAGLPVREPFWLDRWKKIDVYNTLRTKVGRESFTLHDGPPYANGNLHIGHALNKILKDLVVRSQQMMGYDARYIPGWDCHGLPIEWKIEEQYRNKGRNKDDVNIIDFRQECRKFADGWVKVQREEFKRLGVIGNWEKPYLTMNFHAERVIAEEFQKFLMNGTLYQGSKPVMWSPVEKTALAEAEIEYHDHKSHTIWVPFQFKEAPEHIREARVVIWTTTPWTIPSNKAIAYNQKISYGMYEVFETMEESWTATGDLYILADELAESVLIQARVTKFSRVLNVTSKDLESSICLHPFGVLDNFWNYEVPLIEGDHVTSEAGTGFVHTAPSHGADDFDCFVKRNWLDRLTYNVGEESEFLSHVPLFSGLRVFDKKGREDKANSAVIEKLIEVNGLIARGRITHSYPHSWRSKAPIIFRNTPQWFVAIDRDVGDGQDKFGTTIRERALQSIDKLVTWTPVTGRNRLYSMIAARPDWVLSRQRAWGVPLTCFIKKGLFSTDPDFLLRNEEVNKRILAAFEESGADSWYAPGSKEVFLSGIVDPDEYEQIFDILDVWFDSGSTHAFVLRDRDDGSADGLADLYLEGTDQHRGWFHSSMLQSCGTKGHAPYRGVLTHGFTLDEKGIKMSKSLGNTTSPEQVIKQYGADILRLWVAQADYSTDLRIGPEILKGVADSYRRLRNTMRFLLGALSENTNKDRVDVQDMPELERWVLHRLSELDSLVRGAYKRYDFQRVYQEIFTFATLDLSSFYFDIRKDSLYCDSDTSRRRAARMVLDILFHRLTSWLAPILVFTMEEVWLERYSSDDSSIHLNDFPETPTTWLNDDLAVKWSIIRSARRVVTGALELKRQDKTIGASLEAAPIVFVTDQVKDILNSVPFADICITSEVLLSTDVAPEEAFRLDDVKDIAVIFHEAKGKKCQRCWKISLDVGSHNTPNVCARCDVAFVEN
ncbi:MAG: isoleucine--tRNA ligase [Proteobacteria bacterium]|jgi:isoleucyl-tRNA synthetase|nr:isoleucine--tRNA ligase [Pseudomonadota bacterium]